MSPIGDIFYFYRQGENMSKFIFVTGGVVSGLGKGITAASLGLLLKSRGLKVFVQKFDPYLNVDPGTMSPLQHGEVFVTADGTETDLDLGHYERFIDTELNKSSSITTGKIYTEVLNRERRGDYLGGTVQVIPHVTNLIKEKIFEASKSSKADIIITEVGGTVGDIESLPYLETARQVRHELGRENVMFIHATLVPQLETSHELKTKPTQHSVKELRSIGIQPDMIVCRASQHLGDDIKNKVALFCDVDKQSVIEALDAEILYEIPLNLKAQKMDDIVLKQFGIDAKEADLKEWLNLITNIKNSKEEIKVALVGKYVSLHDAYLSVTEALSHAGYKFNTKIKVLWIDAQKVNDQNATELLKTANAIIVPGGFGGRGTEGKISTIKYARENKVPFLGLCLGMQLMAVEFARNVIKLEDANSLEWAETCNSPIISLLNEQKELTYKGGTMRLGNYPLKLLKGSKVFGEYQSELVNERHRHRYEFNNKYRDMFLKHGMVISGTSPDNTLVEILELKDHPWFVATQAHPEFKSRPVRPHPLFVGFIKAGINYKKVK
jgi:CTP synthase